ncbi:MAG TPA: hypothetical protein VNA69_06475 [Thermoanaerobaculia bacterium]|nr:hypothetical protein [Thermoanaerobaculia bacterium]
MILLSRIIAALAYAGAAFLFGILLGERGELGIVQNVFMIVIPVATIVFAFFSQGGRTSRPPRQEADETSALRNGRFEVVLTGLALFAGLSIGQRAFARAFAECPSRAAPLRAAIIEHRARTGDYPTRLKDLDIPLPCGCVLRRTILRYNSNERGFRLWMTNDREVVVIASERSSARSDTTPRPTQRG